MGKNNYAVKYAFSFLISVNAFFFTVNASAKEYFQQEVNYSICVSLDDSNHVLRAYAIIQYINNSPDSLDFLYFHLWPNAYSGNSTELARQLFITYGKQKLFNDQSKRGYIDSLDFYVNGKKASLENTSKEDISILLLPEKLLPGDTLIIETPFRVRIPQGNISRMGFHDGIYQVTQWYPKPAVYDDEGWHPIPYLDQGEFYSEFGNYSVEITLPKDYTVAATGEIIDEEEANWLWKFGYRQQSMTRDVSGSLKQHHFTRDMIHDFAWVASRKFIVIKDSVSLPVSERSVTTMVMFTADQAAFWGNAIEYVNRSILRFSEWIGDYPYDSFTAVQAPLGAGAGMEYPGMTIVASVNDSYSLDEVIAHEVCHSWFYSAVGTNERKFPYLDEALTSAFDDRYMSLYYPGAGLTEAYNINPRLARFMKIDDLPAERISEIEWLITARNNLEQPPDIPADDYTVRNYSDIIYYKAAQGFSMLRSYLGNDLFDKILKDYYSQWQGRHPSPEDLQEIFLKHTNKDLSWFFDDFLATTKRYDYKVKRMEGGKLLVENKGNLNAPVNITGFKDDESIFSTWHEGFIGSRWLDMPTKEVTEIKLNASHVAPEVVHIDNNIRSHGILKKSDPLSPQLLASIENTERYTFVLLPLLNWNRSDGIMAGIALNNGYLVPKRVEYLVMPFYRFRDPGFSGQGRLAFNFIPYDYPVRKLTFSVEGARFGAYELKNYFMVKPGIDISFRNNKPISGGSHRLFSQFIYGTDIRDLVLAGEKTGMRSFWITRYTYERQTLINPYSIAAIYEHGGSFGKASVELQYRLSYNGRNKGLDLRIYTGLMTRVDRGSDLYSFAPSGRSGWELYHFEGDFPDRFAGSVDGFWSKQMLITEGGIITPVNYSTGYSRSIASVSVSSNLPGFAGRIPVKPYFSFVYAPDIEDQFLWETGFKAGLWDFFEIHMPFIVSANVSDAEPLLRERFRFVFNIESLFRVSLR